MAKAECERLSFRGSPFLSSGVRAFAFGRRSLEVVFLLRCPKGRGRPVLLDHLPDLVLSGGGSPCLPPTHSSRFFECPVTEPFVPSHDHACHVRCCSSDCLSS